jgi:hypothetical protein
MFVVALPQPNTTGRIRLRATCTDRSFSSENASGIGSWIPFLEWGKTPVEKTSPDPMISRSRRALPFKIP